MTDAAHARLPTPQLDAPDVFRRILWENEHLVIWDKPAGLPVHPGFGGGSTLSDYLVHLRCDAGGRLPALLHRLDRETSGCLALGRTDEALREYGRMFERQRIRKSYRAILFGRLPQEEGVIDLPLRQERLGAGMRSRVDAAGQPARTEYTLLATAQGLSLVEARPRSGRMHQIRVHFAELGCPIAGDRLYGGQAPEWPQLMLHAARLSLPPTALAPALDIEAPLPESWAEKGFTEGG